ncbi:Asp-tRNA(Asn)/Glu-tRNA(Gln) amidotransferase subunit GatC [candidate division WWE3 bacterium]|uniref:Aspartyl/glutamyl-tRNA(Asn/Gln) amidotransferase subunit C n=1 Tax=candidate division WWE3 bacterium TaxID=2053526 RepID=A0A955LWS1_UNCKA|nr:Asp-tRNA(Asn)/Glu-tRNA(Gln) amidotransferase subunit GatC [candidate division WWE3 bacterium]
MNNDKTLTNEQVAKVASLAKVRVTEAQLETYKEQFGQILDHMDTMAEVDTQNVQATSQVTGLHNVFRDDVVEESLPQETALGMAPESEGSYFKVRAVFGTGEE